ncbi:hypothetical protein J3R30DRAFT_3819822 [Lentinula aciculospora]|uniref:Uncharacterized protein n=1 Tax=Lentinula aciculospora TaxID=153920 RepID=A0A9W9DUE7_9AGAR|nr:hypothetical protein J3R30DRAFT_3819822 [Lentinula aciculospora]
MPSRSARCTRPLVAPIRDSDSNSSNEGGFSSDDMVARAPRARFSSPGELHLNKVARDLSRHTRHVSRPTATQPPNSTPGPTLVNPVLINVKQMSHSYSRTGPPPPSFSQVRSRTVPITSPHYSGHTVTSDGCDMLMTTISTTPHMMRADTVRRTHRPMPSGLNHVDPTALPDLTCTIFLPRRNDHSNDYIRSNPYDSHSPLVPRPSRHFHTRTPQEYLSQHGLNPNHSVYPQYELGIDYNPMTSAPFGTLPPVNDWQCTGNAPSPPFGPGPGQQVHYPRR